MVLTVCFHAALLLFTGIILGEHITDIYITETGTTELENLSHNKIDIFISDLGTFEAWNSCCSL